MKRKELTEKEKEVLNLLSEGMSNEEIALAMNTSIGAVKWHLEQIFKKYEVKSRTKLVVEFLKQKGFENDLPPAA